jgi:nucleoside recognition membrane protein YjiH
MLIQIKHSTTATNVATTIKYATQQQLIGVLVVMVAVVVGVVLMLFTSHTDTLFITWCVLRCHCTVYYTILKKNGLKSFS